MRLRLLPLLFVMLPDLLMPAMAAEPADAPDTQDKAAYAQARKRADVQYMKAKADCERFTGEARDYCQQQAKAEYTTSMNEVQKRYAGGAGARDEATQAAYESEIQACRNLGREARKHCVLDVEIRYR